MSISSNSVIVIQNIINGSSNYQVKNCDFVGKSTVNILGYCDENTTNYTHTGAVIDAVDTDGGVSAVIFYFLSSNSIAITLSAMAVAESISGTVDDTTAEQSGTATSITAGSYLYNEVTYAYKMIVSLEAITDVADSDLLTFDIIALNQTAQEVAESYIIQLQNTTYSPYPNSKFNSYFYTTQLLSDLLQLIPS